MSKFYLRIGCVGKPESGKTAFIRRYRTNEFSRQYVATANVEKHTIIINTTHGMVHCSVFDIPFSASLKISEADGLHALFVFHVSGDEEDLNEYIRRETEGANLLRVDIRSFADADASADAGAADAADAAESPYLHISAKDNKNISEPFARMIRELIEQSATITDNAHTIKPHVVMTSLWSAISAAISRFLNWGTYDDNDFDDLMRGDM